MECRELVSVAVEGGGMTCSEYPVDWSQVVLELRAAGYTYGMQAAVTGLTRSTICRMANDIGEPRWGAGMTLLLKHRLLTRRDPPLLAGAA